MGYRMWRKSGPILPTEGKNGFFDISYGESKAQKLDIWLPEGEGPFPVIISIHGGGFVACDKRQKDMTAPQCAGLPSETRSDGCLGRQCRWIYGADGLPVYR